MATPKNIKIVLVDDHRVWLEGLRQIVSSYEDIEVIGQIRDGEEALQKIQELKPDVALLDIELPQGNGLHVTSQLRAAQSPTGVVILTVHDSPDQLVHAIQSGASAFCAKDIEPEWLVEVIRVVAQGHYVIEDKVYNDEGAQEALEKIIDRLKGKHRDETMQSLSSREMEILLYVTRGYSNKEIAKSLTISNQTVKNHMTAILRKLDVQDRTQAAMYALRHGWIRLSDTLRKDGNEITFGDGEDDDDED